MLKSLKIHISKCAVGSVLKKFELPITKKIKKNGPYSKGFSYNLRYTYFYMTLAEHFFTRHIVYKN